LTTQIDHVAAADRSAATAIDAAIDRRQVILDAVTFAAERFLAGDPLDAALPEVLGRIGSASGAGRVVLIQRVTETDGTFMRRRAEWDAPGVAPLVTPPDPRGYRYFARWAEELAAGHLVAGRVGDLPDDEAIPLARDHVGSIVITPISVAGRWWGHVGYDDARPDRDWTAAELDALRAAAGIISAAIRGSETMETLDRRGAILEAVAATAPMLVATERWTEVLGTLLECVRDAVDARSAWAYRLHPDGEGRLLEERLADGATPDSELRQTVHLTPEGVGRLTSAGCIQNEPIFVRADRATEVVDALGIVSWVLVPIVVDAVPWGAIGLDSSVERSWSDGEVIALQVAASAIAAAVERERTADRMRRAAEMEAVGRVAGGLAHDFGNVLTVIVGSAAFLRDDAHSDQARLDAQNILDAADRASQLVRDLLTFSRRRVGEIGDVNVNERVGNVERILSRAVGSSIDVEVERDLTLPHVVADGAELEHVLVNLVVNARDAMPDGGRITITTARGGTEQEPTRVAITVADTGIGMDEATRLRIFEPFFSTKPEGVGTGLGLATAYGAVSAWGGTIDVESTPGGGTTFTLLLRPAEGF
jgi:signal transduction histidine kinase